MWRELQCVVTVAVAVLHFVIFYSNLPPTRPFFYKYKYISGVEKSMTLTIHTLANVHPHIPVIKLQSAKSFAGPAGSAANASSGGGGGWISKSALALSTISDSNVVASATAGTAAGAGAGAIGSSVITHSSHTRTHKDHKDKDSKKDKKDYPVYAFDNIYITAYHHSRSFFIETDADKKSSDSEEDEEEPIPTTDSDGNILTDEAIADIVASREISVIKKKEMQQKKQLAYAKAREEEEEKEEEWEEIWEDVEIEETRTVTRRKDYLKQAALRADMITASTAVSAFGHAKKHTGPAGNGDSDAVTMAATDMITSASSEPTLSLAPLSETAESHPDLFETVTITELVKHPRKIKRKRVPVPLFTSRCVSRNLVRKRNPDEGVGKLCDPLNAQGTVPNTAVPETNATGAEVATGSAAGSGEDVNATKTDTYYWEDVFEVGLGYGKKMSDYKHIRLEVWRSPTPPVYTSNSTSIYKYIPRLQYMLLKREVTRKCAAISRDGELEGTADYQKRIDQVRWCSKEDTWELYIVAIVLE